MQDIVATLRGESKNPTAAASLVKSSLEVIRKKEPQLNSFSHVFASEALKRAEDIDSQRDGRERLTLRGIPIGIKDNIDTVGVPTAAGSPVLDSTAAEYNAPLVTRLETQGAIVMGKQRMSEAAITDHSKHYPMPKNPWNEALWTGTSSSGSAASVAAGMVYASFATDTGGSLRYPAVMHGLTAIKPTWGRGSQDGIVPLATTLDHPGPMARSARDCALLLEIITNDNQQWFGDQSDLLDRTLSALATDVGAPVIGAVRLDDLNVDTLIANCVVEVLATLRALGASSQEWLYPEEARFAVDDWVPTVAAEFDAHVGREFRQASDGLYGEEVAAYLALSDSQSKFDLVSLSVRREQMRSALNSSMQGLDFLLLPVLGFADANGARMHELTGSEDWKEMVMKYVVPFNFAGLPSVAFPVGFGEEGPIGLQLVGRAGSELNLLRLVSKYQEVTSHHRMFDRLTT